MQNNPTPGNSQNSSINHPAHLEASQKHNEFTDNNQNEELNEAEKEANTSEEDFEKFDIDKVDDLEETKENQDQ